MKYFWVSHTSSYKKEIEGGYIRSPKSNKNGEYHKPYENLKEVSPGDIIFSYSNGEIRAIGIATSYYSEVENLFEPGEEWSTNGWRVNVDFLELEKTFKPKDFIGDIINLLPEKYSPLIKKPGPKQGNGTQGCYFLEISQDLANYLFTALDLENLFLNSYSENSCSAETSKARLVLQRIGQTRFRDELIIKFKGACPMTNIDLKELLRASHIKPWKNANNKERLDPNNGILLSAHFDALFDKGFISFNEDGNLLVRKDVKYVIDKINIENTRINLAEESAPYLQWHREHFKTDLHFEIYKKNKDERE